MNITLRILGCKSIPSTIAAAIAVGCFGFVRAAAAATTISLTSNLDNTIIENATGGVSNGAGQLLIAGRTNAGSNFRRRALISFDIASAIPAGSTISTGSLTLTMTQTSSTTFSVELHRALASWGEGTSDAGVAPGSGAPSTTNDATWLHRFYNTTTWTTQGGDYVTTTTDSQPVNGLGTYTWSSAQLVADIQSMLNMPSANFGWLLIGNEAVSQTTKTFGTHENATPASRPTLVITYNPPARVEKWQPY